MIISTKIKKCYIIKLLKIYLRRQKMERTIMSREIEEQINVLKKLKLRIKKF